MNDYNYLSAHQRRYTDFIINFAKQNNEKDFKNAKTIAEEFNASPNMIIRDIKGMRVILQLKTK